MSIFVQIVSYKNFDTVPTVLDCLEKASDRQSVRVGLVLQQAADLAQRLDDVGLPFVADLEHRAQPVGGQGRPARGAQPAAEQQYVDVAAAAVLEVEARLRDALAGVELEREVPERVGQEIGQLRCFPLAGRRGTRRKATWLEHEHPSVRAAGR